MTDEETLRRLSQLEAQVVELTRRVFRLENPGGTGEIAGQIADPPPLGHVADAVPEAPAAAPPSDIISVPAPPFTTAPAPRSTADWEAALGGNWLNRIGAFVLVVGIELLLGYSFRHMGPIGRDAAGLTLGLAMLGGGIFYEANPRYRNFARGLIGGGWAALYFTAYAMQALDAARIIHSPVVGAVLLPGVAVGMIAHALRYRSEGVAGLAYFSAFGALALTPATAFSLVALLPLAGSLLYVARRFNWRGLALLGLIATYSVCGSRGDTGAPLWAAQAIFAVYWLLFEGFEILLPGTWLMPLNAAGFLLLSLSKWQASNPAQLWAFLAATAGAYVAGGALRAHLHPGISAREGGWPGPLTAAAALGSIAILLHFHHQSALAALLAAGELYFLAGLRLRSEYLRLLAIPLFALELVYLCAVVAPNLPVAAWMPVAAATVAIFYANRALHAADIFYGFAAIGVAALIGGCEAPARESGRVWFLMAAGPFLVGWWRRLPDFRCQAYALAVLAAFASLETAPHPPVSTAIGAALAYALAAFALWSAEDRFVGREQTYLFNAASTGGALLLAILLRALLPASWMGAAWSLETLPSAAFMPPNWSHLAATASGHIIPFLPPCSPRSCSVIGFREAC